MVKIPLDQSHKELGDIYSCRYCPIALALKDYCGRICYVGVTGYVYLNDTGEGPYAYKIRDFPRPYTAAALQQFIKERDYVELY